MSLIPWRHKREDPGGTGETEGALARLRDEVDQVFDRFFGEAWGGGLLNSLTSGLGPGPRVDVAESEDEFTVTAELPGVAPENVEINVVGSMLTIRGEKQQESQEKSHSHLLTERRFGSFARTIQLPASVDPAKVDAVYRNGTVTITLAKHPEAKARRIEIKEG